MREFKSNEIFKPGAFPEHTYISRKSTDYDFTYEFRLQQALNTVGYLTSIIGPSKTGKTVLSEKVIGPDNIISLIGSDFKKSDSFWEVVAKKAGLSLEGEQIETRMLEGKGMSSTMETKSLSVKEKYFSSKDMVIDYFNKKNLVLVLDDFHYAPEELQFEIATQLKDAIRKEFKAIIVSLPHRGDDAIRRNPDLSGRLNLINIEPWQVDELKEIAITGFKALGVVISDELAVDLAEESLTSPQLMQQICFNLAVILNLDNDDTIDQIPDRSVLEKSYRVTTLNLAFAEVVKKLKSGPETRGQKRKTYRLVTGEEADIYSLVLKAIAENPPSISINLEDLKKRIDSLLVNTIDKLDKIKIKAAMKQIQGLMKESESLYHVFEWKDNEIYICEPLFLFYLRWGRQLNN